MWWERGTPAADFERLPAAVILRKPGLLLVLTVVSGLALLPVRQVGFV